MKVATSIVVPTLLVSLLFGLFAQELLMAKGIGMNLSLLSLLLLISVLFLRAKKVINPEIRPIVLIVPCLVAAYGFAVPDSRGLDELNLVMGILTLGYCATRSAARRALNLVECTIKPTFTAILIPLAGFLLAFLGDWSTVTKPKRSKTSRGVLIGAVAAIPFLLIFGNTLAQADPIFANIFSFDLNWNADIVFERFIIFSLSSCFLAGLFIYFSPELFARAEVATGIKRDPSLPIPAPFVSTYAAEATIQFATPPPVVRESPDSPESREGEHIAAFVTFFGLIAVLFLLFVVVQAKYLFGGDSVVLQTAHLTYADYARKGFMEIVGVTAICLPLLLFCQYSIKGFDTSLRKAVNIILVIVVSLLFLLLASATYRLKLYVGAYGLSPLRVYVGAGMVWLFAIFVAYLWFGLRWKLDAVGRFMLASMVMITMGLNLFRPDYWIVRVNLTRSERKNLDISMIAEAGADAASAVQTYGGSQLKFDDKTDLLTHYRERLKQDPHQWKETTISQIQALAALSK